MEHNKEAPGLRRQLAEDTVKANSTLQETIAAATSQTLSMNASSTSKPQRTVTQF
jgi:hypothetical protein